MRIQLGTGYYGISTIADAASTNAKPSASSLKIFGKPIKAKIVLLSTPQSAKTQGKVPAPAQARS